MQLVAIYDYIRFGIAERDLRDAQEGWGVYDEGGRATVVRVFTDYLRQFEFPVTQRAAYELHQLGDEMAELPRDATFTAETARKLNDAIKILERTLFAEAHGKHAFIVTEKRIDVQKLLYDVPSLMGPGTFIALPDIAKRDLMEAGRCIAFERSTAAAFHLLRGTESMLRRFYRSIVKRNRVQLMWGPMVEHLRQRKRKPPPKPLLDHLDNIRLSFRNPTQHPDKEYDIQEVQNLLPLCVDVLDQMVSFLYRDK